MSHNKKHIIDTDFNDNWSLIYLFIKCHNKITCLICYETIAVYKSLKDLEDL